MTWFKNNWWAWHTSKQPRRGSFTAPAPSSVRVSKDLLSALLGREVYLSLLGVSNLPRPCLCPYHTLHPSATVPGHICRAVPSSGSFLPRQQNFYPLLSQLSSLSFMFLLRNMLLLQSFATTSIWQSVGVKPGLYQSAVVKSYLI